MARSQYTCLSCGSADLLGQVVVKKFFPLAARNGSIKLAGKGIDQVEIKLAWDKTESGEERAEKGIIVCAACETQHVYCTSGDVLCLRR